MKLTAFVVATSVFIQGALMAGDKINIENNKIKQDISVKLAHGQIKPEDIHIIAQDRSHSFVLSVAKIKEDNRPLFFAFNNDILIFGNIIDRKTGKSLFENLVRKNKEKLQQFSKNRQRIKQNKKLISLLKTDKYKGAYVKIQGNDKKGKTIYVVTDANCPFCIEEYQKGKLKGLVKKAKNIILVPVFLNIPGHETSFKKAVWLLSNWDKNNRDVLLKKFFDKNNRDFEEITSAEIKNIGKKIKNLMQENVIYGTPAVFDGLGRNLR